MAEMKPQMSPMARPPIHVNCSLPCAHGIEEGSRQRRRQRSSLLFGGQHLLYSLPRELFCTRMIWRKGWIHPMFLSILLQFILFFISSWGNSSFSSNRLGAKLQARQRNESILSPKQQRRPLPSLLSLSFFYGTWSHSLHRCLISKKNLYKFSLEYVYTLYSSGL